MTQVMCHLVVGKSVWLHQQQEMFQSLGVYCDRLGSNIQLLTHIVSKTIKKICQSCL